MFQGHVWCSRGAECRRDEDLGYDLLVSVGVIDVACLCREAFCILAIGIRFEVTKKVLGLVNDAVWCVESTSISACVEWWQRSIIHDDTRKLYTCA